MNNETIGNSIEEQILVQQHRRGSIRHTILRKTLISVAASAALGIAAIAPNAAFAFGPPPAPPGLGGLPHPGFGGPPHLGAGGQPPHAGPSGVRGLSHLSGSPGLRGGGRAFQGNLQGRSASNGYGRSVGTSYGGSGSYGRNGWRNRSYGVYVTGDNGSSTTYDNGGCYYSYSSRQHRRVLVCSEN